MIKTLTDCTVLCDGSVFKYLRIEPESVMLTGAGRIVLHNWKGLLRQVCQFRAVQLADNGSSYVLIHNSFQGYYHWLLESLPKLLEAKTSLSDFVLLLPTTCTASFYFETLTLLGINNIVFLEPRTRYKVPKIAIPYFAEAMGYHSASNLKRLREAILDLTPTDSTSHNRVYVSRKRANRRRIDNESQIEELLVSYGFKIVDFEEYSFREIVSICAGADTLMGIHGAGLANMLFMPEQSTVIEFRKFDKGENLFFEQLSSTLNLNFHLVYCQAVDESLSVQDADLIVDLNRLDILLQSLSKTYS